MIHEKIIRRFKRLAMVEIDTISTEMCNGVNYGYEHLYHNHGGVSWQA